MPRATHTDAHSPVLCVQYASGHPVVARTSRFQRLVLVLPTPAAACVAARVTACVAARGTAGGAGLPMLSGASVFLLLLVAVACAAAHPGFAPAPGRGTQPPRPRSRLGEPPAPRWHSWSAILGGPSAVSLRGAVRAWLLAGLLTPHRLSGNSHLRQTGLGAIAKRCSDGRTWLRPLRGGSESPSPDSAGPGRYDGRHAVARCFVCGGGRGQLCVHGASALLSACSRQAETRGEA